MARVEADREDLMAEAIALVRRIEFQCLEIAATAIAGFRATGRMSIYLGPDMVYQFDEQQRLRRAFIDGLLYRTQGRLLAELRRERSCSETTLVRRDLTDDELAQFRDRLLKEIGRFREQLVQRQAVILRRIPPEDTQLDADIVRELDLILNSREFLAPAIPGKR